MINLALTASAAMSAYELVDKGSVGALLLLTLCVAGLLIYNR